MLGFLWPGWFLWGGILALLGYRHPPVAMERPLEPGERVIGWIATVVLVLTFMPTPFLL